MRTYDKLIETISACQGTGASRPLSGRGTGMVAALLTAQVLHDPRV
jgi:hypothetical protein